MRVSQEIAGWELYVHRPNKTMNKLILFAVAVAAVVAFLKILKEKGLPKFDKKVEVEKEENLPYAKKKYLITIAEKKFFDALQEAVGDQYYIFPQIHLPSLLFINARGREWTSYFAKIRQKSVDFVLCDKQYLTPVLAIELNDSSHERLDRQERDGFVNKVFASAKIPLLSMKCQYSYDKENLKEKVKNIINNQTGS